MTFKEQFSHKNIIDNLAKYEMYYQVSLGSLIADSKTKELDPNIELQYALGSLYEMISELIKLDNANELLDSELQKQAAMDALQYFVNENLEMVKEAQLSVEPIVNNVNDNTFFNQSMIDICNENLQNQRSKWNDVITQDLAQQIYASVEQLQEDQN